MADGIHFDVDLNKINPFTNKSVTDLDRILVDTDGNGDLSEAEWTEAQAYYISVADGEGDVQIDDPDNNPLLNAMKEAEIPESASSKSDFSKIMDDVLDAYIELFLTENFVLDDTEKAAVIDIIKKVKDAFVKDYTANNTEFVMQTAILEFDKAVKQTLQAKKTQKTANDIIIERYTDSAADSLFSLFDLATDALANDNVSNAEFNKMKAAAVKYLMGMLLSDELDETLVNNLDPKGSARNEYTKAKTAIEKLKNETDPDKVKQYLNEALTALNNFVENCGNKYGKKQIADGALDAQKVQIENGMTKILDDYIQKYKEQVITADMTDEQKAYLDKFLSTCEKKFIAKIFEEDKANEYTDTALINQFSAYINQQLSQLAEEQSRSMESATKITNNWDNLVAISNKASENNNISPEEKEELVKAAIELIKSQLAAGVEDLALLDNLDPSYKSALSQVQNKIAQIMTSVDPDEIKQLEKEIDELLKAYFDKFDGQKLVDAINKTKPVEISNDTKTRAAWNSTIAGEYETGACRTSKYGKQNEETLKDIQEQAKADILAYAEQLKIEMRKELGNAYNEEEIERYIQDAMNDTIGLFTKNAERIKRKNDTYSTATDKQAFVFERRTATHKGRYVYNVKALIDTFVSCFNKTSKQKQPAKLDPSLATFDYENVIENSLGNEYWRNETYTVKASSSDDEKAYAELINKAKEDLKKVGEALKDSLKAEGLNIPDSVIDQYIEDCIYDTIQDMKKAFQKCHPDGKTSGGGITAYSMGGAGVGLGTAMGIAGASTVSGLGVSVATALGVHTTVTTGAAAGSLTATGAAISSAVPVVGWCVAGALVAYSVLKNYTNLFGATWGKHNADAGFFYERKSNSHSGRFGYDPQTLVDVFLNKINNKIKEWKQQEKDKKSRAEEIQ